jgi:hypothetical protein
MESKPHALDAARPLLRRRHAQLALPLRPRFSSFAPMTVGQVTVAILHRSDSEFGPDSAGTRPMSNLAGEAPRAAPSSRDLLPLDGLTRTPCESRSRFPRPDDEPERSAASRRKGARTSETLEEGTQPP